MAFAPTAFSPCMSRVSHRCGARQHENSVALPRAFGLKSRRPATSLSALESVPEAGAAQVFEPVVNVPALGSFLIILLVFSLLQWRISAVEKAAGRRKEALEQLRVVKSKELSSVGDARPDAEMVSNALREYENALNEEKSLRTVVPGVRIVAPNGPAENSYEDIAAAKQFLGVDLEPGREKEEERTGLSTGAVAVLAVVALSQLGLLYMLSFDPMGAYTSLGGQPPADLPPSSW